MPRNTCLVNNPCDEADDVCRQRGQAKKEYDIPRGQLEEWEVGGANLSCVHLAVVVPNGVIKVLERLSAMIRLFSGILRIEIIQETPK